MTIGQMDARLIQMGEDRERIRAAKVARDAKLTGVALLHPMFNVGYNAACEAIAKAIEEAQ